MKVNMGQPNDLLLDDLELLLREIDEFNNAIANNKPVDIPQSLENYLQFVAKSGNTVFPWPHVRNLIRTKMVNAIQQFQEPTCPTESFVLERFDLFRVAAPFTVQRLTELILQPTRHYRKKEKFLRGLEKTVLVVSTIEPYSLTNEEKNGNDLNNTSSSSCEAETETVTFNRTITLDPQDILTSSIRTSAIDVLNQSTSDSIVLDPVTTSAVSTAVGVDIINQNVSVTSGDTNSISTSAISSVDVITSEKSSPVSSDGIILDAVSESVATTVVSMESSEAQETLSSSIDVINQSTTENMVIDSVVSTVSTVADNVDATPNLCVTSVSSVNENVSTTDAPPVAVVASDKAISSDGVLLDTVYDPSTADVSCKEPVEVQDILTSSIRASVVDVLSQNTSDSIVLDSVTTSAVSTAVGIINQSVNAASCDTDSISTSVVSSVDVITSEKSVPVSSDGIILDGASDAAATTVVRMESDDEVQEALSSSLEVITESTTENMVIDSVVSTVSTVADDITPNLCATSVCSVTENENASSSATVVPSVVDGSDKAINSDDALLDTGYNPSSADASNKESEETADVR